MEGETLHTLAAQNGERLHAIMNQLANGAPAPAWGDDNTCRFCAMAGICRRAAWLETAPSPNSAKG
jgi:ATP-dependent helicase/nuclease subunit B